MQKHVSLVDLEKYCKMSLYALQKISLDTTENGPSKVWVSNTQPSPDPLPPSNKHRCEPRPTSPPDDAQRRSHLSRGLLQLTQHSLSQPFKDPQRNPRRPAIYHVTNTAALYATGENTRNSRLCLFAWLFTILLLWRFLISSKR